MGVEMREPKTERMMWGLLERLVLQSVQSVMKRKWMERKRRKDELLSVGIEMKRFLSLRVLFLVQDRVVDIQMNGVGMLTT